MSMATDLVDELNMRERACRTIPYFGDDIWTFIEKHPNYDAAATEAIDPIYGPGHPRNDHIVFRDRSRLVRDNGVWRPSLSLKRPTPLKAGPDTRMKAS